MEVCSDSSGVLAILGLYERSEKHSDSREWLQGILVEIGLLSSYIPCIDDLKIDGFLL